MDDVKGMLLKRVEMGQFFGRSLPTIDVWIADGCPIYEKGGRGQGYKFDSAAVVDWLISQAVTKQVGKLNTVDLGQVRREKMEYEARMAKLNYEKARGLLVPIDILKAAGAEAFNACKTRLIQLKRIVREIRGAKTLYEAEKIFVAAILEALSVLGDYAGPEEGTDSGVDVGAQAASQADNQSVGGQVS